MEAENCRLFLLNLYDVKHDWKVFVSYIYIYCVTIINNYFIFSYKTCSYFSRSHVQVAENNLTLHFLYNARKIWIWIYVVLYENVMKRNIIPTWLVKLFNIVSHLFTAAIFVWIQKQVSVFFMEQQTEYLFIQTVQRVSEGSGNISWTSSDFNWMFCAVMETHERHKLLPDDF